MSKAAFYWSIGQVARFLDVSVVTLRRWEKEGQLTSNHRTQLMWLDTPLPEDKARVLILRQWLDWLTYNRVGSLKAALHWQTLVDKRSNTSDRLPKVIEQQPGGLYAGGACPTNKLIESRYKAKLRWTE